MSFSQARRADVRPMLRPLLSYFDIFDWPNCLDIGPLALRTGLATFRPANSCSFQVVSDIVVSAMLWMPAQTSLCAGTWYSRYWLIARGVLLTPSYRSIAGHQVRECAHYKHVNSSPLCVYSCARCRLINESWSSRRPTTRTFQIISAKARV